MFDGAISSVVDTYIDMTIYVNTRTTLDTAPTNIKCEGISSTRFYLLIFFIIFYLIFISYTFTLIIHKELCNTTMY